eukprot:scaffold13373_cov102-Isochrysis_galbana.AAC.8
MGLILASISDGGRSFAKAILATTGRWSECAAPVKVVGGEPICCHLHTEAWAWVRAYSAKLQAVARASASAASKRQRAETDGSAAQLQQGGARGDSS